MKVPNYEQALVPKEKLINYLLDFEHVDGSTHVSLILQTEKKKYRNLAYASRTNR